MEYPMGINFEIKNGLKHYFYYTKSLVFLRPKGAKAEFTPGTPFYDDIDLNIRPWSWWLVLDDLTLVSAVYHGTYQSPVLEITDSRTGSNIVFPLKEEQAQELLTTIMDAMTDVSERAEFAHKETPKLSSELKQGPDRYVGLKSSVIRYPVTSQIHTIICKETDIKTLQLVPLKNRNKKNRNTQKAKK